MDESIRCTRSAHRRWPCRRVECPYHLRSHPASQDGSSLVDMIGKDGCAWLLDEGVQAGIDWGDPAGDITVSCLTCRHQLDVKRCSKCLAHALFESK